MPKTTLDEESIEISSSERFQSGNDDDEQLWDVKTILSEKKGFYKVEWVGVDPATGKKWPPSWVRKGDVTDDLVKKWKLKKRQQEEEKATRKRSKSGKRDSAVSVVLGSRSNSTRRSTSTVKAPTPAIRGSESPPPSRQQDVTRNGKAPNGKTLSRHAGDASPQFREASPLLEEVRNPKRKRESSLGAASISPPPQIVSTPHSTPLIRPRKKRRVGSSYHPQQVDEEEDIEIPRPTVNKSPQYVDVGSGPESEEEAQVKVKVKLEKLDKSKQLKKGRAVDDEEVEVVSSPPKAPKSSRQPRLISQPRLINGIRDPYMDPKKHISDIPPISSLSPTKKRKKSDDPKQRTPQTNGVVSTRRSRSREVSTSSNPNARGTHLIKERNKANYEPPVRSPIDDGRRKQAPKRRARELSPDTQARLARFDAELDELERERKRPEKENVEEEEESALEYVSLPPSSSLSSTRARNAAPAPQPNRPRPLFRFLQRHSPKKLVNEKATNDSFRQGIVPETEPEDLSANTQSQSQSQPMSQPVPSLPSMVVEPPASLRSRPSTPSQPQTAQTPKSHPGSSDIVSKPSVREQPPSQDADISAPFDSIEPESQEPPSPSKPLLHPVTAEAQSSIDSSNRADDPTSSIEQFSSPEKPNTGKGNTREVNGRERTPGESTTIHKRGQQLAETAWLAKLHSRPQVPKRPLAEVMAQQVQHSRGVGLPPTSAPRAVFPSTLESASSLPIAISHPAADGNRGLPDVPDEVVQELEAALIDLDGGTNKQTQDDTLEDRSTSVQESSGHSATTNAPSVFVLRQEEEESTQDSFGEAQITKKSTDAKVDDEKPIPSGSQERQPPGEVEPTARSPQQIQARSPSPVQPPQQDLVKQALVEPFSPPELPISESEEIQAVYDKPKWEAELASLKTEWDSERASLTGVAEAAVKEKEEAVRESNFFREQYARASAFVTSVRDENAELEKRARIAEDQAKSGVAMVKAMFESRVKELEQHVEKWQMMATFLIQKDKRTDNDELRRRAAAEPELRAQCKTQDEDIIALNSEIIQLEEELKLRDKEMEDWKQEAERLVEELKDSKAEVERLTRAAAENEMVYRCLWRLENDKPCEEVFSAAQDLKTHLYSAGHIIWD